MRTGYLARAALPLMLVGCATTTVPAAPVATASLRAASGPAVADATIRLNRNALSLRLTARGMAPGTYGAHIHAVGQCDAPAFTTAGPHWNPTQRQHGRDSPMGAHHGDLPNLVIGADGTGVLEAGIAGTATELFDGDGASVIIHAAADDLRTDPTGNSGGRMLCGVLAPPLN